MHMAGPALSNRHNNNRGSTPPSRFTIGTFNIRGLSSATKRGQLSEDLNRLYVDICCLLATTSHGGFDARPGNYLLLGQQSQPRHYGLVLHLCTGLRHHQRLSDV